MPCLGQMMAAANNNDIDSFWQSTRESNEFQAIMSYRQTRPSSASRTPESTRVIKEATEITSLSRSVSMASLTNSSISDQGRTSNRSMSLSMPLLPSFNMPVETRQRPASMDQSHSERQSRVRAMLRKDAKEGTGSFGSLNLSMNSAQYNKSFGEDVGASFMFHPIRKDSKSVCETRSC